MNYDETLHFIHSIPRFKPRAGLEATRNLLSQMGKPQKKLKFIHVAGTNGKGSTSTILSSVLSSAGYRTGTFISPYVYDFCERMQVNGELIPREALCAIVSRLRPFIENALESGDNAPAQFDVVTVIGLCYFAMAGCDIVVLEAGMGGLTDATNVIECPEVSVLTSISFDHMQYLGNTLPEIALQKCGIIKPGRPVVSYPMQRPEVMEVIRTAADAKRCPIHIPEISGLSVLERTAEGSRIQYKKEEYFIPLAGEHQIMNALTALETIEVLRRNGFSLPYNAVRRGLEQTHFAGRFEKLQDNPPFFIDGAHNEGGAITLASLCDDLFADKRVIMLMGMLKDKPYLQCVPPLAKRAAVFLAITPEDPRALPASLLAEAARGYCSDVRICDDIKSAAGLAIDLARREDGVAIACGSLSYIGKIRDALKDY